MLGPRPGASARHTTLRLRHATGYSTPQRLTAPTMFLAPGGHSRVTHSRNLGDTGGHRRTRRRLSSGTGGTTRTPQDTRGHGISAVRDREAPGSNPGPPTNVLNSDLCSCA